MLPSPLSHFPGTSAPLLDLGFVSFNFLKSSAIAVSIQKKKQRVSKLRAHLISTYQVQARDTLWFWWKRWKGMADGVPGWEGNEVRKLFLLSVLIVGCLETNPNSWADQRTHQRTIHQSRNSMQSLLEAMSSVYAQENLYRWRQTSPYSLMWIKQYQKGRGEKSIKEKRMKISESFMAIWDSRKIPASSFLHFPGILLLALKIASQFLFFIKGNNWMPAMLLHNV